VDGWHQPREVRLRRGQESPEGYYLDSFDLEALVDDLLTPFRHGSPDVPAARFDHHADRPVRVHKHVPQRAALLFGGVFLLRQELVTHWDLRVYLHVPEEITLSRALVRDLHLFRDAAAVQHRYERRYLPAQAALYRDSDSPREAADVILDNSDWRDPIILRWPGDR
jgi:uridine kinase